MNSDEKKKIRGNNEIGKPAPEQEEIKGIHAKGAPEKTVRIALLDDDQGHLAGLHDMIKSYADSIPEKLVICEFNNGKRLLDTLNREGKFDGYIMKVRMAEESGLSAAEQIRKIDREGRIIFFSETSEYALAAYDVHAFSYLIQPIDSARLRCILDEALSGNKGEEDPDTELIVRTSNGNRIIEVTEISYIDMQKRILQYHMTDGTLIEGTTLRVPFRKAVARILENPNFALMGVSTVVNLKEVVSVKRDAVILRNGTDLFPSRAIYAAFKEAWERVWSMK